MNMILTDYDNNTTAVLNPTELEKRVEGMPKVAITCFSKELLDSLVKYFNGVEFSNTSAANGRVPTYKIVYKDKEYALFMTRVGAPACIVQYEELYAQGVEKIVVFGTCGVLDSSIDDLGIIVPNAAIRDEGTSYHYIPASDEIECNTKYIDIFTDVLKEHNYSYTIGKTWTTDAPYRETRDKMNKRKQQGCVCVEMECSAIFALAKFRNKEAFQFFYAADNLDNVEWDIRSLDNSAKLDDKTKIGLLAIDFASKIN